MLPPNEEIRLTYDWNPRDKYNRLLAYVWFKVKYQGKEYWILHNLALIFNGFGHAYTVFYFRDDYRKIFLEAERFAREHNIGLWSNEDEKKVVDVLKAHNGSVGQKIIVRETGFSKAKVSRLVNSLKERNVIIVEPISGRENRIVLKTTKE